jgi:hypothetical protein
MQASCTFDALGFRARLEFYSQKNLVSVNGRKTKDRFFIPATEAFVGGGAIGLHYTLLR